MKERPILFSDPIVRAILGGRKSQTRRVLKGALEITGLASPKDWDKFRASDQMKPWAEWGPQSGAVVLQHADEVVALKCPYGKPGDLLWVREAWQAPGLKRVYYRATDHIPSRIACDWCPSIHMPRWASRITLEIAGVRVERVQDISTADAWAEGCRCNCTSPVPLCKGNLDAFCDLWDSINGKRPGCSWTDNPWVWVIEFKPLP